MHVHAALKMKQNLVPIVVHGETEAPSILISEFLRHRVGVFPPGEEGDSELQGRFRFLDYQSQSTTSKQNGAITVMAKEKAAAQRTTLPRVVSFPASHPSFKNFTCRDNHKAVTKQEKHDQDASNWEFER